MVDAALQAGRHQTPSVFELFARSLPAGRRYGVVAGTGRFLQLLRDFRFTESDLAWLAEERVVGDRTLDYLADWRFTGTIRGYREGELYFPGSPLVTVEAPFGEGVLVETLALSVFNHDSAVASAASRMVIAAGGRPLAEMGSRRTGEQSAVAAARAAYIAGFDSSSNLEAGRVWGVPTMGTAAHSFTLLFEKEADAFQAQVQALGQSTTLLVDTYDIAAAVRTAVEVAGPSLGGVRIDSGDLPIVVREVRQLLDELGNTHTTITVTNDLDEHSIAALGTAPVDAFGVGTSVVTGSGHPAAGMVYKLVARQSPVGEWIPVAKRSAHKVSLGGRKTAFRVLDGGRAVQERVMPDQQGVVSPKDARPLVCTLVHEGDPAAEFVGPAGVQGAREHHQYCIQELPLDALRLSDGAAAIPTVVVES